MNFFVHPLAWNRKNTAILRLIAISQNSLPLSLIDKLLFLLSKLENLNYCPDIWTNKSESRLKSRYIELTTLTQHIFPRICNMRKHKTQEWKGEKKNWLLCCFSCCCFVSIVRLSTLNARLHLILFVLCPSVFIVCARRWAESNKRIIDLRSIMATKIKTHKTSVGEFVRWPNNKFDSKQISVNDE